MGKREFLEMLGAKLIEELPRSLVLSHLQYYDEYISNEVRNGKKEAQVMEELGDPVMIAHTIMPQPENLSRGMWRTPNLQKYQKKRPSRKHRIQRRK